MDFTQASCIRHSPESYYTFRSREREDEKVCEGVQKKKVSHESMNTIQKRFVFPSYTIWLQSV